MESDLDIARSEWDTQKSAYEEQIKSLIFLITKLKDKVNNIEDRMDEEYDSRLAFSYNCIMSILKNEYPKLKIDKLEASVNKYMA